MRHHPGEDLLLAYAMGASGEAVSLIVAAHLGFCADCRKSLAALEAAGGVLLADLQPAALGEGALDQVLARLGGQAPKPAPAPRIDSDVPAPLRAYVGNQMGAVSWRPVAPGISYRPFFKKGSTRAQLIRVEPGHGVADHTHEGAELSLVLAGGYTDETGQYGVGDFQTTSPEIEHAPTADADGTCIILAVTEAPLVFRGWLPRLIGKLAGF
jgi:putative transcriptional regulator